MDGINVAAPEGYEPVVVGEPIPPGSLWQDSDETWRETTHTVGQVYIRDNPGTPGATWHAPHVKPIKSLSLDEILAEQEAKPSEVPAPTLREKLDATGWICRLEVSTDLPKHDGHYRTLEAKGAEPIERMEALVCRGIPEDLHRIAKRNLNMAMASKHQDRAGEKSGEAWEKELQKAENYLHRAWAGRWIG